MAVIEKLPESLEDLVVVYDNAWNAYDLEGILALQTEDSKFILRGGGAPQTWEGIAACRQCFDYLIKAWPGYHMERTQLFVSDGIYVANHWFKGTLGLPWEMGGKTYEPAGQKVEFEMVDIMYCEGNKVKVKDGWIDGVALQQQLEAQAS